MFYCESKDDLVKIVSVGKLQLSNTENCILCRLYILCS